MKSKRRNLQIPALGSTDNCQAALDEISRILAKNHRMLRENNHMLKAIIKHLGVPYKPSARLVKE